MTFVPKDWQDSPSNATPISAAALADIESRLAAYTDSQIATTGIAGSTTGGGAQTPTAGRTSTIAAPTLRDFISVKDSGYNAKGGGRAFSAGANVSGSTFTDAANNSALSSATGMTVIIPGAGTNGRNFSSPVTSVTSANVVVLTNAPPNPGGVTGPWQLVWDDTTPVQTALTNVGTGTLWFGNDTYGISHTTITPSGGIGPKLLGHSATIYKIMGNSTDATIMSPVFGSAITDGTTLSTGLTMEGFTFYDVGQAGYTPTDQNLGKGQHALGLYQFADVHITRCRFYDYNAACLDFRDSRDVWVTECHFERVQPTAGGQNVINFGDSPSGGSLLITDFYFIGNTLLNFNSAGLGIFMAYRNVGTELRTVITNNVMVSATSNTFGHCVSCELNTYKNGVITGALLRKIIIANNHLKYTGPSTRGCVFIADDPGGAFYTNDPTKIQDVLIQGNVMESSANAAAGNGNGIVYAYGSRMTVVGNVCTATGTDGCCMFIQSVGVVSGDSTLSTQLAIANNQFTTTNTGATNHGVLINGYSNFRIHNNDFFSSSTTSGSAISIRSLTASSKFAITHNRINAPAECGITIPGGINDATISGNHIYNPNGRNIASISQGSGIYVNGACGGTQNIIEDNKIWDDRNTHQMQYGVVLNSVTGTIPLVGPNHIRGVVISVYNWQTTPEIHGLQSPLRISAGSTTIGKHELGVILTTAGTTATLPIGLTTMQAGNSYVVKNASSGSVTVSNGANKIDAITGGLNSSTNSLSTAAQANVYIPATNLLDYFIA